MDTVPWPAPSGAVFIYKRRPASRCGDMLIEQEYTLFRRFLSARGKIIAPEVVRRFIEALNISPRDRLGMLANMPSGPGSAVVELFDEYHLFLASQDPALPKKAGTP